MAAVMNEGQLVRGLGWLSIGLGVAEMLAPGRLSRWIGIEDGKALMRAVGFRELTSGIGILSQERPRGWISARVAGDIMDLSLLGYAAQSGAAKPRRAGWAALAVAGIAALDVLARYRFAGASEHIVRESVAIDAAPEDLYALWSDPENLPRFMKNLIAVQRRGESRWHWVAKGPAGSTIEWDADIVEDRPNEWIIWRSTDDADIQNLGGVRFARLPGDRGTAVTVEMRYRAPGIVWGSKLAKLIGDAPEQQLWEALHTLKQIVETGEVATTVGQPAGRRGLSVFEKFKHAVEA